MSKRKRSCNIEGFADFHSTTEQRAEYIRLYNEKHNPRPKKKKKAKLPPKIHIPPPPLRPRPTGVPNNNGITFLRTLLISLLPNSSLSASAAIVTAPFLYPWAPLIEAFSSLACVQEGAERGVTIRHTNRDTLIRVTCPRVLLLALALGESQLARGYRVAMPEILPQPNIVARISPKHPLSIRLMQRVNVEVFPLSFLSAGCVYQCSNACAQCPSPPPALSLPKPEATLEATFMKQALSAKPRRADSKVTKCQTPPSSFLSSSSSSSPSSALLHPPPPLLCLSPFQIIFLLLLPCLPPPLLLPIQTLHSLILTHKLCQTEQSLRASIVLTVQTTQGRVRMA
jgi:hypothetical protein